MNEKELHQQKMKAQLDEWKADADKLKAKASGASADARLALDKQVKDLDARIESGKARLAELAAAPEEAWESVKGRVDSAWEVLKTAIKKDPAEPRK